MVKQHTNQSRTLLVRSGEPVYVVPIDLDGVEYELYVAGDDAAEELRTPESLRDALNLAGAWSDMDGDAMLEALQRMRRESKPTPPIDDL
jgi:hypothetical protein